MTSTSISSTTPAKAAQSTLLLGAALMSGALSQAIFGFAVAQWFSTEATGAFFTGLAVLTLIGYLGRFGTEQLALREASPAWSNGDHVAFREIVTWMRWTVLRCTAITFAGTLAVLCAIALVVRPDSLLNSPEVWLATVAMAPLNMITTGCALLRAGDRLVASITARYLAVFGPALAILAIAVAIDGVPDSPMLAVSISALLVAGAVWREVASLTPPTHASGTPPRSVAYVAPQRRAAATQLTTTTVLNAMLTWTDRLILGAIAGTAAVGVYGVAWQLVLPFNLIHLLSGTISSPIFARLHAADDRARLEATTRALSLANAVGATVLASIIFVASPMILSTIGDAYRDARALVIILAIGQIISLSAGQVGVLYAMAGQDRELLRITGYSALASLVITIILTIPFGSVGTAIGVTAGLASKNISLALAARTHLDIAPLFFLPRRQQRISNPVNALLWMLSR